ncbi:Cof-type HAD-IIB family hydrolase [Candidatus Riesia pediculicola]|uniref:YigL n=1 Tax=Riesia pediculicola (strain USDA) TaxID=515618 RepID=D4G846_RIEPU|nr:Cof-type HAD-IIB family hydrolase [Candidatus Riesia pediculicola]ADD79406.1 YigL [Candidatus Riesia pediculicola USDA]ARC53751.1 hydrolase [Candidatus Riesia pediculicola]QOJ86391.1 Cof-type HAD-IIB family hydrolase [Candidatus Riesia pediculicola]
MIYNYKKKKNRYSIVALDLDGTLLSPKYTLLPHTIETLQILSHLNVHIVFATGRHYIDVQRIRKKLDINGYMITSNGSRIHDPSGKNIFKKDLERKIVYDLCKMEFDNPNILTHFYSSCHWFVNRDSPEQKNFFQESSFNYQIFNLENFPKNNVSKVYFTCNDQNLLAFLQDKIKKRWGKRLNVNFSFHSCLEVTDGGVSKGSALKKVANLLGYSLQDCIAFGDGMNDYDMLKTVGKGCLMENSHESLIKSLPDFEIIGSNKDESVSHYLRKNFIE